MTVLLYVRTYMPACMPDQTTACLLSLFEQTHLMQLHHWNHSILPPLQLMNVNPCTLALVNMALHSLLPISLNGSYRLRILVLQLLDTNQGYPRRLPHHLHYPWVCTFQRQVGNLGSQQVISILMFLLPEKCTIASEAELLNQIEKLAVCMGAGSPPSNPSKLLHVFVDGCGWIFAIHGTFLTS